MNVIVEVDAYGEAQTGVEVTPETLSAHVNLPIKRKAAVLRGTLEKTLLSSRKQPTHAYISMLKV